MLTRDEQIPILNFENFTPASFRKSSQMLNIGVKQASNSSSEEYER